MNLYLVKMARSIQERQDGDLLARVEGSSAIHGTRSLCGHSLTHEEAPTRIRAKEELSNTKSHHIEILHYLAYLPSLLFIALYFLCLSFLEFSSTDCRIETRDGNGSGSGWVEPKPDP
jgi:hypothetical protein